ncbi:hypothetical protein AB6D92_24530 [Vibrio splendidus]
MSKVVAAVNTMITNEKKISPVLVGTDSLEIYFSYNKKYNWSLALNDDEDCFYLHYYPASSFDIKDLSQMESFEFSDIINVTYSSKDLGSREAYQTFKELHNLLQEKVYGIDKVLDDILASDDFF